MEHSLKCHSSASVLPPFTVRAEKDERTAFRALASATVVACASVAALPRTRVLASESLSDPAMRSAVAKHIAALEKAEACAQKLRGDVLTCTRLVRVQKLCDVLKTAIDRTRAKLTDVEAIVRRTEYVHSTATLDAKAHKLFHEERIQHASDAVARNSASLREHERLFGDEAPKTAGALRAVVAEMERAREASEEEIREVEAWLKTLGDDADSSSDEKSNDDSDEDSDSDSDSD